MLQTIHIANDEQRQQFLCAPGMPALNADAVARQKPDAHLMIADAVGRVLARCSLWWTEAPPHENHHLGLIGHYAALDEEAAGSLLQQACTQLKQQQCTMAVGPMDGNTWQRYRLLTERGTAPLFFLEPDNPDQWPGQFVANGFTVLSEYFSALTTELHQRDERMPQVAERLRDHGVIIRALQMENFVGEMARIYAVSEISFVKNFLYTPISREDFIAQYLPVKPYVAPALVEIAEHHGAPVGFIFTLPDILQAQRGQQIETAIVKTVAVLPDKQYAGLGSLLVARSHQHAQQQGFKNVIHALMHENNKSRSISRHYAQTMRRYALYAKAL